MDFLKPPLPFKAASGLNLLRPPPYSIAHRDSSFSSPPKNHAPENEYERAKRGREKVRENPRERANPKRERKLGLERGKRERKKRKGGVSIRGRERER